MKLEKEPALDLVRKWKILEKYPTSDAGEEALAEALAKMSPPIASQYVLNWIRENRKCPMPVDIYSHLGRSQKPARVQISDFPPIPKGEAIPPPEFSCNQCEDTGWYIIELPQRSADTNIPYTATKRCYHPAEHRGKRWGVRKY